MEEIKLVTQLLGVLLLQLLFLPFRGLALGFAIVEGVSRTLKETIHSFIKHVKDEIK